MLLLSVAPEVKITSSGWHATTCGDLGPGLVHAFLSRLPVQVSPAARVAELLVQVAQDLLPDLGIERGGRITVQINRPPGRWLISHDGGGGCCDRGHGHDDSACRYRNVRNDTAMMFVS